MNYQTLLNQATTLLGAAIVFATSAITAHAGGLTFDTAGNLFALDKHSVSKFTPDATKSTFASGVDNLSSPADLAFDRAGNLFVLPIRELDHKVGISPSIVKFDSAGIKTTFASDWLSPDKKWEYQGDASWAGIVKPGTTETILDLGEDAGATQLDSANVVWAPDSKRFAFNYRMPASHFVYATIALYQLRDGEWVELKSPVELDAKARPQLAQLAKGQMSKSASPVIDLTGDILKVVKWIDGSTALLYASEEGERRSHAPRMSYLFTLKFDAEGNSKIIKTQPLSEKEDEELNE
jgi:hypothetical protein